MDIAKISPESIAVKIGDVRYSHDNMVTFCIIEMLSGFIVTGQSACASPADYDLEKGKKMAYRDAFAKLFLMEQYARRDAATHTQEKAA